MDIVINGLHFDIIGEVENLYRQFGEKELKVFNDEINELVNLDLLVNSTYYDNCTNKYGSKYTKPPTNELLSHIIYDIAYFADNIQTPLFNCRGPIYLYEDGERIKEYKSLLCCVKDYKRGNLYGFGNGIIPTKGKQDFFGVSVRQMFKEKSLVNQDVTGLNNWIRLLANNLTKHTNDKERFYIKYWGLLCLFDNYYHNFGFEQDDISIPTKDVILSSQYALHALCKRYTVDGKCAIQKVKDLSILKGPGIYILSVKTEAKYYVGQTRKCLKDRIVQHFTQQNSMFDTAHGIDDIDAIYCIDMSERDYLVEYIDLFEQDIISCIPNQCLLNCLAGGVGTIRSIDEKLPPQDYMKELIYCLVPW